MYDIYPKTIRILCNTSFVIAQVYENRIEFNNNKVPTLFCEEPKRSAIIAHIEYFIKHNKYEGRKEN